MKRFFNILPLIILLAIILAPLPVNAYNQGNGDAHSLMVRQAINILRNDGYPEMADAVERNLEAITDGIRAADDEFGRITLEIVGYDAANWNAAGNTHYYNPGAHHEQAGLKIGLLHGTDSSIYFGYGWFITIGTSLVPGDGDSNRVFALRGPQPSANRLADWYYAMAVKAMREGRTYDAYFNLGKAVHMVQDLTVPHHGADSYGICDLHQAYEDNADIFMERGSYLATTAYPGDPALTTYLPDLPVSTFADSAARISRELLGDVTEWWGLAHTYSSYEHVFARLLPLAQQYTAGILYKFHENWQTEAYSAIKVTVHRAKALDEPDSVWAADLFVSLNVLEPGESASSYSYNFDTDDFVTGYFGDEDEVWPGSYLGYDVWTFPYTSDTVRTGEEVQMVLALWDDDDIDGWTNGVSGWPESLYAPHWIDINPVDFYRLQLKANFRTGEVSRWTGSDWYVIGRLGESITSVGNQSWKNLSHGGRGEIEFTIGGIYLPAQEPVPLPPQTPRNIFPGTIGDMVTGVTLTPILYASSYSDPDFSPQMNSEWQIMDTADRVVFHNYNGRMTLQEIASPLEPGTLYKWQVRYQDSTGLWSKWSRQTLFITDRSPQAPVNELPATEATGESVRPLLRASAYSDRESHPHIASQWEIDVLGSVLGRPTFLNVYRHASEGTTSHRVAADLSGNSTYFWRVRYQDALGVWSEWSERTSFTTGIAIYTPPATIMPSLEVISPNGGEALLIGSEYGINWRTIGASIASVDIDYSTDAGSTWSSVARGISNVGTFTWTLPNTPSNTCLVKVAGLDRDGRSVATDQSDRNFSIISPVSNTKVIINSPKLTEVWRVGTAHNIAWTTTGEGIAYVNIYYSTDGGKSFRTIAEKENNDGAYAWTVPNTPSNTALVRIIAVNSKGENVALGDSGLFVMEASSVTKVTVNVTSPKSGETWRVGTAQNIYWSTTGEGIAWVDIYYSTDGGKSMISIARNEADDGTYAWKVPNTPTQTAMVRVLAFNTKGENLALGDSGSFRINIQ